MIYSLFYYKRDEVNFIKTANEQKSITKQSLDYFIKGQLAEYFYMTINNLYEHSDVTEEEFKVALDNGMRSDAEKMIKAYYNFIEDTDVALYDRDYYDLHMLMSS